MNSFVLLALASVLMCASAGVLVPGVQYHGQDLIGGYAYGYATPDIETKTEVRQLDGSVLAGYKYLDGFGQIQHTIGYNADPKIGFQVAATHLPIASIQDTPEVTLAKNEHLKAVELAKMQQHLVIPQVGYTGFAQPVIAKTTVDVIPTKDSLIMMEELKKKDMIKDIKDTMEVVKAKEEHLKAVEKELQLQKEHEKIIMMKSSADMMIKPDLMAIKSDIYSPSLSLIKPDIYSMKSDYTLLKNEPILPFVKAHSFAPIVKTEPIVPLVKTLPLTKSDLISHQYHSQDELGRFAYSYDDANSAKVETGLAGKDVTGQYSYVDANSKLQTVRYIADDKGFRVAATNLPIHEVMSGDSLIKDAKYQMTYI